MSASARKADGVATPPPWLRGAVREVLERAPAYAELDAPSRLTLARAMLQVSSVAAELIAEEQAAQAQIDRPAAPPPLARAQEQPAFGTATDRIAETTRNVLGAVSFPRFVTDLINGVFRSMLDSTSQQMQMYVNLLNSVSASLGGFENSQTSLEGARQWVADHFPGQIAYEPPDIEPGATPDPEDMPVGRLQLVANASMPDAEQIRATLGLEPQEPVTASNPEQLVPLARRAIARQRQSMLATMVQMGMQRIVIDSGRINASMRFHIDTRSAASEDRGSQFATQNRVKASGNYGVGVWGASAEIENTISYVSTQRSQATEEINTDLELNSSVELNFRTDYLPLNRMAAQAQADRIRNASLNPVAPSDGSAERRARIDAQRQSDQQRREGLLTMPTMPAATPREPARPAQPAQSAQPAQPAPTAQPAQPAPTVQPAQPAPAARSAPAGQPAGQPAGATNTAQRAQPAQAARPAPAAPAPQAARVPAPA